MSKQLSQNQDFNFFDLSYIKNDKARAFTKFAIIAFIVAFVVILTFNSAHADGFTYDGAYEETKTQIGLAVTAMIGLFTTGATAHTAMKVWSYTKMGIKRV